MKLQLSFYFAALALCFAVEQASGFAFTFNTTSVTQCSDVLVSWSGGTAPFYLSIVPAYDYPVNITLPSASFDSTTSSGSYVWTANFPSTVNFVAVLSDATGLTNALVSSLMTISPGSSSCTLRSTAQEFYFDLSPATGSVQTCSRLSVTWNNTKEVELLGVIPQGKAFILTQTTSEGYNWDVNLAAGTQYILATTAADGSTGGSSSVITVPSGSSDTSCMDSSSPSATASGDQSVWGTGTIATSTSATGVSATKTSGTSSATSGKASASSSTTASGSGGHSSLSTGAIAGVAVGSIAIFAIAQVFVWWFCCRRRRRSRDDNGHLRGKGGFFESKDEGREVGTFVAEEDVADLGGSGGFGKKFSRMLHGPRDSTALRRDPNLLEIDPFTGGPTSSSNFSSGPTTPITPVTNTNNRTSEYADDEIETMGDAISTRRGSAGTFSAFNFMTRPESSNVDTNEPIGMQQLNNHTRVSSTGSNPFEPSASSQWGAASTNTGSSPTHLRYSASSGTLPNNTAATPHELRQTKAQLALANPDEPATPTVFNRHLDAGRIEPEEALQNGAEIDLPPMYGDWSMSGRGGQPPAGQQ